MRIVLALPVLNEEKVLRQTVEIVRHFALSALVGHEVTIVVADNGSTDLTEKIGRALASELPGVRYIRLQRRGKGLAIREAWTSQDADVYAFMDADLATDLTALPELIRRIEDGAALAVGSRFHPGSVVDRSTFRKILSRGYRILLGAALGTSVTDVPCGFKAASAGLVRDVMPSVHDDQWFFDTEFVVRAERAGHRIDEVPVTWRETQPAGRASKVKVLSLVKEYLAKVLRLRRELGLPRTTAPRTPVTRAEWRLVACGAALVMAITAIPPIVAIVHAARHGVTWTGRQFLSPGDTAVYFSYIAQAKEGRWLFENYFTTETLPRMLNVFWLGVGLLARAFSLTPVAAYHVARSLLIPVLAAAAYLLFARMLPAKGDRAAAFIMFMGASGVGAYALPFLTNVPTKASAYEFPIDGWVSESNAFMSMLYSPHFIASLALIIGIAYLLLKAYDGGRWRDAAAAGLAGLVLFQFHPFHAPTLYAVGAVWLCQRLLRGARMRPVLAYAMFVAISVPSVAYHYFILLATEYSFLRLTNDTPTPSLIYVLVGFGAIAAFALIGYWECIGGPARQPYRREMAAWAVTQFLLLYAPFPFQRRLVEGLQVPLVVLAAPAVVAVVAGIAARVRRGDMNLAVAGIMAGYLLFLPSTVAAFARSVDAYAEDRPPIYYLDADGAAMLAWLRDRTPVGITVLSTVDTGNLVAGWAARRAYAGHWAGTADIVRKNGEITAFYGAEDDAARSAFLRSHGIGYVVWGPSERALGGDLTRSSLLEPVFLSGDVSVFRVRTD